MYSHLKTFSYDTLFSIIILINNQQDYKSYLLFSMCMTIPFEIF